MKVNYDIKLILIFLIPLTFSLPVTSQKQIQFTGQIKDKILNSYSGILLIKTSKSVFGIDPQKQDIFWENNEFSNLDFSIFKIVSQFMFRISLGENELKVIKKIQECSFPLSYLSYVSWGAQPGTKNDFMYFRKNDKLINDKNILSWNQFKDKSEKCLKGEYVKRYATLWNGTEYYILYDINKLHRPAFPALFESSKMIICKVTGERGLIVAHDDEGYYTEDSVANVILKKSLINVDKLILKRRGIKLKLEYNRPEPVAFDRSFISFDEYEGDALAYTRGCDIFKEDLEELHNTLYLTTILNSSLMNFYFTNYLSGDLNVFPELIRQLPIRSIKFSSEAYREDHLSKFIQLYVTFINTFDSNEILKYVSEKIASNEIDLIHDFLTFIAKQMIEMNKLKYKIIRDIYTDLDGVLGNKLENISRLYTPPRPPNPDKIKDEKKSTNNNFFIFLLLHKYKTQKHHMIQNGYHFFHLLPSFYHHDQVIIIFFESDHFLFLNLFVLKTYLAQEKNIVLHQAMSVRI